jgi:hypothetical protein
MKSFTIPALFVSACLGVSMFAGCDRTVSETERTKVNDGRVTTERDKTVEHPDGSVERVKTKDVDTVNHDHDADVKVKIDH